MHLSFLLSFILRFLHDGLGGRRGQGGMLHDKPLCPLPCQTLPHLAGVVCREGALPVQLLVPVGKGCVHLGFGGLQALPLGYQQKPQPAAQLALCLPPMLILDEATSSIDTRTEVRIQKAFARMMQGRTSFIVAHRLSTIREADVILVMRDGHIVEQGSHDQLLAQGGFYAKLYNSQFEGVET